MDLCNLDIEASNLLLQVSNKGPMHIAVMSSGFKLKGLENIWYPLDTSNFSVKKIQEQMMMERTLYFLNRHLFIAKFGSSFNISTNKFI